MALMCQRCGEINGTVARQWPNYETMESEFLCWDCFEPTWRSRVEGTGVYYLEKLRARGKQANLFDFGE